MSISNDLVDASMSDTPPSNSYPSTSGDLSDTSACSLPCSGGDADNKELITDHGPSKKSKDDESKQNRDEYINILSGETKKCIAASHLFGKIWYQYFMDEENKCEYIDYSDTQSDDYFDILDHILVRGGCVRDVLWNKDFNDIDAAVNTRELNKLHLLHLKKVHSTKESQENSNCILWLHYARKFDNNKTAKETKHDFDDDKTGAKIIKSQYMLNAKLLLNILQNDARIKDKLSVAIMGGSKRVWNIRIIDTLIYNGYDLNGFDFDFLDIKHGVLELDEEEEERGKVEKIHKLNRAKTLKKSSHLLSVGANDKYRAMYSIRVQSELKLFQDIDKDENAKSIDLPIYPLGFVQMSKWTDLTVNSMIIHFSDIIKGEFGEYTIDNDKAIDYDWRAKVKNSSFDIDGITDCKEKNIKTWGNNVNQVKQVIKKGHQPIKHIMRVCKMWIKLNGKGNMDKDLIKGTIETYSSWFSAQKVNENDDYAKEIAKRLINDYAKRGKYNLRFGCLEILQFNSICKDIMQKLPKFKKYVNDAIDDVNDDQTKTEIKTVMKQYGYNIDMDRITE